MLIPVQKFKAYVLESDKMVDALAYLLTFGMALKDKPRAFNAYSLAVVDLRRKPWSLPRIVLHHSNALCGASFWCKIVVSHQSAGTLEMAGSRHCRRLHDHSWFLGFPWC